MLKEKPIYICGPLTELPNEKQGQAKVFYEKISELCQDVTGLRGFLPHEHYDPVKHANFTPSAVDAAERNQVSEKTSILLVVAIAPSWGGGIEVEIANRNNIPVIILCEKEKLENRKISRLLRGNPAVKVIIPYDTEEDALKKLRAELTTILEKT